MGNISQDLQKEKIIVEIIWWVVSFLFAAVIILPILQKTTYFPFTLINVFFVVTFITIFRHIFFLKHALIARAQYVKLIIIFICIPLIFNLVNNLNFFITRIDELSYEPYLGHLEPVIRTGLEKYIRIEMILFGAGSVIAAVILPFRMAVSIWKQKNRGVV